MNVEAGLCTRPINWGRQRVRPLPKGAALKGCATKLDSSPQKRYPEGVMEKVVTVILGAAIESPKLVRFAT